MWLAKVVHLLTECDWQKLSSFSLNVAGKGCPTPHCMWLSNVVTHLTACDWQMLCQYSHCMWLSNVVYLLTECAGRGCPTPHCMWLANVVNHLTTRDWLAKVVHLLTARDWLAKTCPSSHCMWSAKTGLFSHCMWLPKVAYLFAVSSKGFLSSHCMGLAKKPLYTFSLRVTGKNVFIFSLHVTGKRCPLSHCMWLATVRRSLGEGENPVEVYWLFPLFNDGSFPYWPRLPTAPPPLMEFCRQKKAALTATFWYVWCFRVKQSVNNAFRLQLESSTVIVFVFVFSILP